MAYDAVLRSLDEVEDFVDFIAHGDLFGNFDDGVFEAEVASVDDAVGVGYVAQYAVGYVEVFEHDGVDTVVGGGVAAEDDVGGYVLRYTASALDEREAAHANVLLHHYTVALDGIVMQFAFAGNAAADAHNAFVVYLNVMADVYTVHDEVFISNPGGFFGIGAAGNYHVLADVVVVAYHYVGGLSLHIVKILGSGTDNSILVNGVAAAHGGTFENGDMGLDDAVVANHRIGFDVGEGAYLYIVSQLSLGVNVC